MIWFKPGVPIGHRRIWHKATTFALRHAIYLKRDLTRM
jgi:hypothetical protein